MKILVIGQKWTEVELAFVAKNCSSDILYNVHDAIIFDDEKFVTIIVEFEYRF